GFFHLLSQTLAMLSQPHVIEQLEVEPELGSGSQDFCQQEGGFRCYSPSIAAQFVDRFATDTHSLCQFPLGDIQRLQKLFFEHSAHTGWRLSWNSQCFSHNFISYLWV